MGAMTYVEAPGDYTGHAPGVFLAGGITDCPDWQTDAVTHLADLPAAIFNPRRADFPIHDPSAAHDQIGWEYRHLDRANVVLFWFAEGPSVQPIALYELGFRAAGSKRLAVGAHPDYLRRNDVLEQLALARPRLTVYDSLTATCEEARRFIEGLPRPVVAA